MLPQGEIAKHSLSELIQDNPDWCEVEWMTPGTSWGFVMYLRAQPENLQKLMTGAAKLGLTISVRRQKQVEGEWAYETWVDVPEGWQEPGEPNVSATQ